jgi:hypothetical protein
VEDPAEWDEYDDYAIYDFKTNTGAVSALGIAYKSVKSLLKHRWLT